MGLADRVKGVFRTLKQNVRYECEACDFETERKQFETDGGNLTRPECGSTRVHMDD
jgi:hypothetical protein